MNLLYLHTHDMGRFNGIYGYQIHTPAMLSVAYDGTVFRNAYCACPTCSPSRGALLTGMMPHTNGLMGLAHRGSSIRDHSHHLASFLGSQGYHTTLVGIQHETDEDAHILGYESVIPADRTGDLRERSRRIADQAAGAIRKGLKEPFFLSVGFEITHRPFLERQVDPDYVCVPSCLPDNSRVREDYADYMTSCQALDEDMQTVLEALKRAGMYDNTVIVLTTDHGIAFPFMKCNLYDAGTGVTLAVKPAGGKPAVKCTDALVSQIDVFPTICDLLGLDKPDWLEGVSFAGVMDGTVESTRQELFTEITFHASYEPVRAIRTERYKYIRHFDSEFTGRVMCNMDDGLTKRYLMEAGIAGIPIDREELYDLQLDPGERNNLCGDVRMAEVLSDLRERLDQWMRRTEDPLLTGSLLDYPGQLLNAREQLHPDRNYVGK